VAQCQVPGDRLQNIIYYSAPRRRSPEGPFGGRPRAYQTYQKLGISLGEQERLSGVAVDAVFDSVSVATTFKRNSANSGSYSVSFSERSVNTPTS